MKFFLFSLCFFGVVFAEQFQSRWIRSSISNLSSSIESSNRTAEGYSKIGLYYFGNQTSALVSRMDQIRTEIQQLPVEKSNSIHPSASQSIRGEFDIQEQIIERLQNDLRLVDKDQETLTKEYGRERTKMVALFVAAQQLNDGNDAEMPKPEKLTGDVKAIIAQELAIKQAESADKPRLVAELDDQYQTLNASLLEADVRLNQYTEEYYDQIVPKAKLTILILRKNATPEENKQANMLQEALDPSLESSIGATRLVPIQSADTVDLFLDRARDDIKAGKKLVSLLQGQAPALEAAKLKCKCGKKAD